MLRLLVPTGFMPVTAADGTLTVRICSGDMAETTVRIAIPRGPTGHGDGQTPAKADAPCAFAGLAMPMLSGADVLLLAAAIAFVLAVAFASVPAPPFRRPARLRPPLRGPPIPA